MITAQLKDGLGNRLFQVSALLGYAERWGLKPVFFPGRIDHCIHEGADAAPSLFPDIPIVWDLDSVLTDSAATIKELAKDCHSYVEREKPSLTLIVLNGYFQTERYMPSRGITLNYAALISPERMAELQTHYRMCGWWVHVRLGDYMILPHHQIDVGAYLAKALAAADIPSGTSVAVYSDTLDIALRLLGGLRPDIVWVGPPEGLKTVETLYAMSLADQGCICGNSSFSWWGAYGSAARKAGRPVYFPGRWSQLGIASEGIYPSWGTVIEF
jgi:hypothetical protein